MLKKIAAISCAVILCSSLIIPSPRIEHSNVAIVNAAEGEKSYTDKYDVTYSFTVDTSDNTACLTGVSNAKADLILPSTVSSNGSTYTVTKIGEYFARKNTVIKSVTIPDSIYYLGHGCFRETTNLANIYGANSIKEVGMYSFYNTKWDNNIEDNQGYCILGKAFFKNYSKKNTIDLSSNKYDNIEYICESSFTPSSSTMEKLILPKNITCISRDALQGHHTVNQRHILNEVKFYDKSLNQYVDLYDVCMSENKNAFQSEFLDNFYETFDLTSLCDRITIDYTKGFFKDLGINYIGSTDNTGYSAWEEYKIVLKIYKYIGQNFTKYNNSDTMNSNFKSELFNHHGIACIAYADMLKYFCNAAGIKCEEVSSGSEGGHFWNNVNIGGQWFNVDCCWTWNWYLTGFLTTDDVIEAVNCHTKIGESRKISCTTQIGDVNCDGYIDATDSAKILKIYSSLGSTTPTNTFSSFDLVLCDVNRDGYVDSVDAAQVLKYYSYISTLNGSEAPSIEQYMSDNGYYIISH